MEGHSSEMKIVSLITLQNIKNYGSMLQAFATQEILKANGFLVKIVDYTRKDALFWRHIMAYSKNDNFIIKLIKTIVLFPTEIRYRLLWRRFSKKHLDCTQKKYTCLTDLKQNPPKADIYCVGSDQVWNSAWNGGFLGEFFLEYAPENCPKYALASSIALDNLKDEEKQKTKEMLERFSLISIRERTGLNLLNDMGIKNVCEVLDPTLTVDESFWCKFESKRRVVKKPYLLIYQLGKNPSLDIWAKRIAKQKKLSIVRLCIRYDNFTRLGKPVLLPSFKKFLSLFHYCDCVITDSFHASCFSINFNKDFWCVLPDDYSGRIKDLLTKFELDNRILKDDDERLTPFNSINYERVNYLLSRERELTYNFYKQIER